MLHILDILAVREAVARQPKRRREICEMLMEGYSRAEIAGRLGIAEMTVHTHIRRIRRSFIKMGFEPAPRRREPRSPGTGPREKELFPRVPVLRGQCLCKGGEERAR